MISENKVTLVEYAFYYVLNPAVPKFMKFDPKCAKSRLLYGTISGKLVDATDKSDFKLSQKTYGDQTETLKSDFKLTQKIFGNQTETLLRKGSTHTNTSTAWTDLTKHNFLP